MSLFYWVIGMSSSVLIGSVIAVFKWRQIRPEYHPFIFLMWLACLNETISVLLILNHQNNILNNMIYTLLEALLLMWFFRNIGLFVGRVWLLRLLVGTIISVWIVENFIKNNFGEAFSSYCTVTSSLMIVLLAVTAVNRLLFHERDLVKHPTFLICLGLIIFFTYTIVVEMFWLYGLRETRAFRLNVQIILMVINFICNLIYALAIVWMRRKQAFTLQF